MERKQTKVVVRITGLRVVMRVTHSSASGRRDTFEVAFTLSPRAMAAHRLNAALFGKSVERELSAQFREPLDGSEPGLAAALDSFLRPEEMTYSRPSLAAHILTWTWNNNVFESPEEWRTAKAVREEANVWISESDATDSEAARLRLCVEAALRGDAAEARKIVRPLFKRWDRERSAAAGKAAS